MAPAFDTEVLEDDGVTRVVIDSSGAKKREFIDKTEMSMPQWLEFPVKTPEDFEEMKKRYNPKSPCRYPMYWDDLKRYWKDRDYPLMLSCGSFFGWIRSWMGLENLLIAFYDGPDFVKEMMDYLGDFFVEVLGRAVSEVDIDYACFWEDMAFKSASLISPKMFREFMVPNYQKVTSLLRDNGIDIIMVDSDGNIDELIPLWLEGGLSGVYPLEVAAENDAVKLRKQYGEKLMMWGNIDKRVLAKDEEAIKKEVMDKVPYLIDEGGFIPTVDHSVPPDVPFFNYMYYRELVEKLAEGT